MFHQSLSMTEMQNKTILDKIILVCLIVVNATFLVYWGVLAYYSQLHYDDLHFLWKMREMSVIDYVKDMYFNRSGRFVSYVVNGVVSNITDALGFHQLWAIIYYALGLGVCWLVVRDVKLALSKLALFMGMAFVYNLYILTNIDFPVFFWLCAMSYYLFLPMACLLLKYLNAEKLSWWQWVVMIVLAVLIGGGNEAFTPIVLMLMLVSGMYWWHSRGWKVKETWALPQVKRIVWTAVLMLVLFTVVVMAPGNYARMNTGEEFVHPIGAIGWVRATADAVVMFCWFMAFYIPYYLVVFGLAYYIGGKYGIQLPTSKRNIVIIVIVAFVVYLIVSSLPSVFLFNGFGVQRNYTHVVFSLLLMIVMIGYVLGNGKRFDVSGWLCIAGVVALVVVMCINIKQDAHTARHYGKAVDERIERLCSLRDDGQKETVSVPQLPIPYTEDTKHFLLTLIGKETPQPVLYYISDTDTVPNEYEYHMKRVLNLGFDFVLDDSHGIENKN